jgi:hypothetical protein
MRQLLRRLFTPFQSNPRRWLWVGVLLLVILLLALTGQLR